MQIIILSVIIFFSVPSLAQPSWTDKFTIKTTFELGDLKTYQVGEFFKIDNLFFGGRYEVESTVSFQVVDTAAGGYWINYRASTNSVSQHRDSSAHIIAALLNGIDLFIYAKNGHLQLDSTKYADTKKRIANELDSMSVKRAFGKTSNQFIQYLKSELKQEAGLGFLLAPLMLFEEYYSSREFKKFRITVAGNARDILYKPLFNGEVGREWKSTSKDSLVKLNSIFTGHPFAAAQYYKSIYEPILAANGIRRGKHFWPPQMKYESNCIFHCQPGNSFPKSLNKKVVSEYIFRSVLKLEMTEI